MVYCNQLLIINNCSYTTNSWWLTSKYEWFIDMEPSSLTGLMMSAIKESTGRNSTSDMRTKRLILHSDSWCNQGCWLLNAWVFDTNDCTDHVVSLLINHHSLVVSTNNSMVACCYYHQHFPTIEVIADSESLNNHMFVCYNHFLWLHLFYLCDW